VSHNLSSNNIGQPKEKQLPRQRALVLQGGAAMGAYEAGVYRVLYDWIYRQIKDEENVFDILAGTSIGSINSAILLNHVLKRRKEQGITNKKSWECSAEKLEKFWTKDTSTLTTAESPLFEHWWNYMYGLVPNAATSGQARRHYSVKQLKTFGAINVFSPKLPFKQDTKFFDYSANNPVLYWARYTNEPLKNIIRKHYWDDKKYPIKTKSENNQPRLLVISIDVEAGRTVAFDSYGKVKRDQNNKHILKDENGDVLYSWQTEYEDGDDNITIEYPNGIQLDHVIASSTVPINYDYTVIKVKDKKGNETSRFFWDGQYISSTPLREIINAHQKYWKDNIESKLGYQGLEDKITSVDQQDRYGIPNLDVYVVNVWPTKEKPAPQDHDGQLNRKNDIIFHDKTVYEEKIANLVNDYADLTRDLIEILKKNAVIEGKTKEIEKKLKDLLHKTGKSKSRRDKPRTYLEILTGGFIIERIMRVELASDHDTISEKWADYSRRTISVLLDEGKKDALKTLTNNLRKSIDAGLQDPITNKKPSAEIRNRLSAHLRETDDLLKNYEPSKYGVIMNKLWSFIDLVNKMKSEDDKIGLTPNQSSLLLP